MIENMVRKLTDVPTSTRKQYILTKGQFRKIDVQVGFDRHPEPN